MPSQMVHLAVAVKLYEYDKEEPGPSFLLGSVAPDAIHMRPGSNREDKKRTHLGIIQSGVDADGIIPGFVRPYFEAESTEDVRQTILGYAAHLLTDYYWLQTLNREYVDAVAPRLSKEEIRTLYYRETDKNEFRLYREAPWRPRIWDSLRAARALDVAPYLTAEEISLWRERVLTWPEVNQEQDVVPEYFTPVKIERFINEAAAYVKHQLAEYREALRK